MGFISEKDILDSQLANHADAFKSDDELKLEAYLTTVAMVVADVPKMSTPELNVVVQGLFSEVADTINEFQARTQ